MEIYSLKDIESIILNSNLLLAKKSKEQKFLLIDKHNFVLNLITIHNIASDNPHYFFSNINAVTLKRALGDRYYIDILANLEQLGVIQRNDTYSSNSFSKSYCIPKSVIEKHPVIRTEAKSIRFQKKLKEYVEKEFEEINKDPIFHKILLNTSRLKILPEFSYYIPMPKFKEFWENNNGELITISEDNSTQMFRYDEFASALQRFNKTTSLKNIYSENIFYKPKRANSGRVYHIVSSIPRLIRHCLRTKNNELIYEIDMASAQPSILILEYLKQLKSRPKSVSKEEKKEANKCLNILLQGKIYKYVQDNSNYYKNLPYNDLKKSILTTLNAKKNNSIYNQELLKVFPFFMKWINNIKKEEGHKRVSSIGQSAEANIFVKVYNEIKPDIFALIIHDCILTTNEHTNEIKQRLMEMVKELYSEVLDKNADLTNLFKIDIVSLKDEELPSYQENQFSKIMFEIKKND
jgi:hypothetical protein